MNTPVVHSIPSESNRSPSQRPGRGALPFALFLAGAVLGTGSRAAEPALVENDRSEYRIVVRPDAIPSEQFAAEELANHVERMTGVRIPVVPDTEPLRPREILIGNNAHLRQLGIEVDANLVGPDGFLLRTHRQHLVIAGGQPRGTLNGVHTFLEETLGVRWFTPELTVVPRTHRIALPRLDTVRVPALEYREVFWTEAMRDGDFASRHRLNGQNCHLIARHGGAAVVYFPFVHSFDELIPPALFKEHPEYFPLIDGRRRDGYVQRCLSNPDVVRLAIERVRQWIRDHPEANLISVSQNDTFNYCQCDPCRQFDEAEGSPAASLIRFVNRIAEAAEQERPGIRLDTLAYQYTRRPPRNLVPRANVVVRLCSIECCFAHPLGSCPAQENRRFQEDVVAWQSSAPRIYVWDYTTNFGHYQQPFPNFDVLQTNVQFFVEHGVRGLFEQGNYSAGGGGAMGPLRAYLLAKLLWDPDTDLARHQAEFLNAYYGAAAPEIAAALETTQGGVRGRKCHAHIFDKPTACYLDPEVMDAADRHLERGETLVDDPALRQRVRTARLPFWYVRLATGRVPEPDRKALLQHFLETARQAGITHISESQGLEDWAAKQPGA